jgi:DNA polymerase III epsilon subunit-like protein
MNFVSIDFETANYSRASICAAGLAVFEDGQLSEAPYWLAGRVLLAMMQHAKAPTPHDLLQKMGMEPARFDR